MVIDRLVDPRVGNRPGRPTGAYGLACLSLAWPVYEKG